MNMESLLLVGITIFVTFVLFASLFFATPVLAFTTSFSAGSISSSQPALPTVVHRTLTSPNATQDGYFGYSVAVSGQIALVGAQYEYAGAYPFAGQAYMFNANTGMLVRTLTSPDAQAYGFFGYSVAISGNTIVVGSPAENASQVYESGQAYIFNALTGRVICALTDPKPQSIGYFGYSVAVGGGIAAVGEQRAGHVYTFDVTTCRLTRAFRSPDHRRGRLSFGTSIAVSGGTLLVGAPDEHTNGQAFGGHVYSFSVATGKLIRTFASPGRGGQFGFSVAPSGRFLVVGAPTEHANGRKYAGHVFLFDAETGKLIDTFTSPKPRFAGYFGYSVAISGNILVIGAPGENASLHNNAGDAYSFNALTGKLISTFASANPQHFGQFGFSVGVSGKFILIGAPFESAKGHIEAGHAYIF